ncbi:response regulator transcription factor [Agromyces sp. H3Y2-19a]|uniref:response regulator transcription factor n=1 Tax=Agromyces TaxID=33877 RepID=UPI0023B9548D|nr:response regulator transcription factor [Agromyces chromiiresistens]MDF0513808.1 response regulator transcription factor [Agromyces chromiiresistens]
MRILLADDDEQLQRALRITLAARGYDVLHARDGAEAIDQAANGHPDLILLDLGMPKVDGIDVIRAVRAWSSVPILVLSGRTDSGEKVEALDAGADDYVTKPFAMDELLARIRARSRRPADDGDGAAVHRVGELEVDLAARVVRPVASEGGGREASVRLTPTEWRLLELFLKHPGRLLTREMLLSEVWGPYHANDAGYLRLYVAQLRRKLEPVPSEPRHFLNEPGLGYRFEP